MTSQLEVIVEETKKAYELQLQVTEQLRNRDNIDPYEAGISSLSSGIRFAAVFRTMSKSEPFLQTAWKFLMAAREVTGSDGAGDAFNPASAYIQMRIFWGLSGLSRLLGKSGSLDYLRASWKSLRPAFSDEWSKTLQRRVSSGIEDLKSLSVVQLVFLGLSTLLTMSGCDCGVEASTRRETENVLSLPVLGEYRDLRSSLGLLAVASPNLSTAADLIPTYVDAYGRVLNLNSYEKGLVAGFTFVEAWLLAVVRESGDFEAGARRLFL